MKTTEKQTRKFTRGEKLAILTETRQDGVRVTLRKYELYPATYYSWKRNYIVYGEEGLVHHTRRIRKARIKRLEKENEQLKIFNLQMRANPHQTW